MTIIGDAISLTVVLVDFAFRRRDGHHQAWRYHTHNMNFWSPHHFPRVFVLNSPEKEAKAEREEKEARLLRSRRPLNLVRPRLAYR